MELEILIQNLRNKDPEIRSLSLGTLSRYKFKKDDDSESILKVQEILMEYERIEDEESKRLIQAVIENFQRQIVGNDQQSDGSGNKEQHLMIDLSNLYHSDSKVRKQCLVQIINLKELDAYPSILEILIDEENDIVLSLAMKALSEIAEPKIVKLLEVFLYHHEPKVRRNCITAISDFGHYKEIIDLILPSLDLLQAEEITTTSNALSRYNSTDIVSHLKSKLQDGQEYRRLKAIESLDKLDGDEIIELINIATNDRSPKVRISSLKALFGRTQHNLIEPILNRLVQDTDIEVSEIALQYLDSSPNQEPVKRIKLLHQENSLANISTEIEDQSKVEMHSSQKSSELIFKDAASVDNQIELRFLDLGRVLYRKTSVKEIDIKLLKTHIIEINNRIETISKLEQAKQNRNLVKSLQKVLSGNLNYKLTLQRAKISLEEAYIDLGEQGFNIICAEELSIEGIEASINGLNELFKLRKELSRPSN